ncbi:hypothetical protein AWJ20_1662 [Sugiyamaella lignohabitans]|uniref:Uncharacterized protein n=1 Tax=Sugiyamaella lignohabitans TaxID=796027 RepID=A0A167DWD4_9ASCO|nr:uncharacterized protein AWJ20_1662 [Sugiyamaella lignohabitans]ANB13374.1 hypothetical protein AWJ20_1662 [Sugiyamaella lignohabitans]
MVVTSPFVLQAEVHPEYNAASAVYNWKSSRTGLQVVLIQHETPVVNGYFAVASEVSNDSGTPHTLEHLIFMGSKTYPYKGLLDTVGNKMFSTTNAWTGTDQTVYTLVTAGWEGFRDLLPVYLDHVLNPTLNDNACLTEVYHIDGTAEEKGVVFSEMQGVENTSSSLIAERAQKLLFKADSGYSSNTGGLMDALRVLTNEEIRDFHKLRYTPDNLCVIVTGPVTPEELIKVMSEFDNSLDYVSDVNFKRPFVDSERDPVPLKNTRDEIEFPEADEDFGEVQLSWKGPSALELLDNTALHILGSYFTTEGSGKLPLAIVDVSDPLATDVSFYTDDYIDTICHFYVSGVPTERLAEVENEVLKVVEQQVSNFDLAFIRECIVRKKNKFILGAEKDPSSLAYIAIDNFLYGSRDGKHLIEWTQDASEYDTLLNWTEDAWTELITKYFIKNPRIVVRGRPSTKLFEQLNSEKEQRIKTYKEKFGEEGLKKLERQLESAQKENNMPIPNEIIDSFQAPNPERIRFIQTNSADAGLALTPTSEHSRFQESIISDTPKDFPLYVHFEQFESKFVAVRIFFSSFVVDEALLPYIEVLFSELFSLPMVLPDGTKLSYEEVVRDVKKDTLENSISSAGQFEEFVTLKLQATVENYSKVVEWAIRALWYTVFDEDRIKVLIEKHLNGLSEEKRDGSNILSSEILKATLSPRSLKRQSDNLVSEEFYEDLFEKIENGQFEDIKADLEKLRMSLFSLNNMRVLVMGGIDQIRNPVASWSSLIDATRKKHGNEQKADLVPIPRSVEVRSSKGRSLEKEAFITPMSASESSYLAVLSKGPTDYKDEDIPALAVCCSYLQAVEGPLWRGVRGTGLAYGASLFRSMEQGQIVLDIYRGTDAGKAVSVTKSIVEDLCDGREKFEKRFIEGAISSIVNSIASNESNFYTAASSKFFDNYVKKRGPNFNQSFMEAIKQVGEQQLQFVLRKYIRPMFHAHTSMVFVACNVSMVESLQKQLALSGYEVTVNAMVGADDSDEDESGDDDDDDDDDDEDDEEEEESEEEIEE